MVAQNQRELKHVHTVIFHIPGKVLYVYLTSSLIFCCGFNNFKAHFTLGLHIATPSISQKAGYLNGCTTVQCGQFDVRQYVVKNEKMHD